MDYPDLSDFERQGEGGTYGQVWKATTQEGETRALKVFDEGHRYAERDMLREARILEFVQGNDHVVKFFMTFNGNDSNVPRYDELDSKFFLLIEYIDGSDMWDPEQQSREENMDWICKQCFDGLKFLHEKGVVHRDLKGGNIMIERPGNGSKGRVVIVDFGLSCVNPEVLDIQRCEITQAGTYFYLSPEMGKPLWWRKEIPFEVEYANDVWGMGMTLFEYFGYLTPGKGMETLFPDFVWNNMAQLFYDNLQQIDALRFEQGKKKVTQNLFFEVEGGKFEVQAEKYINVLGTCFNPMKSRPSASQLKTSMDRLQSF
jgi:serine/threonine protein kinase